MLCLENWQEKASKHELRRCKVNCGMLPNFLLFGAYNYGFFILLCLRLDKRIKLSYFVILIPVWIMLIYIIVFATIVGIASHNSRVNSCEKVLVSLLVPLGFLSTIILVICQVEGYIKSKVWAYLFLP